MKRLNLTVDEKLYENTRKVSFVTRRSISDILREAMEEWLINHKIGEKGELLLESDDEKEILEILEKDEFVSIEKVKEELKI